MSKRNKKQQSERFRVKPLQAKTEHQTDYIRSIVENDVTFCSGPAGSGKSYIACGIASQHLHTAKIGNLVITRPIVSAGKGLGALPGPVNEKIDPYLLPMKKHLQTFLGMGLYGEYANSHRIQYLPLETMRGSTFDNSYMILDEAQNCTLEQIKMFITRIGEGSKVIINGDCRQTDLSRNSGLSLCIERLQNIDKVGVCEFDNSDIQRNRIIGSILTALENTHAI